MRIAVFCLALSVTGFSGSLFANVGTTSAGVTTSVGNSTDPSPDVQAQSAGFVQQNQQLQNAATPNGTTATSATVATTATSGTPTAGNAGNGANADPAQPAQAGAAAPPAAPPAPPPTYESTMRRLERHNDAGPTVVASGPRGAVRKAEVAEPANPPAPAAVAPPTNAPAAPTNRAAVEPPAERIPQPPAVTGGRGAAPDGFTFYSGLTVAGALLAFAFATYLRMGRSET